MLDEKTINYIKSSYAEEAAALCIKAYEYADSLHKEQKRASGEPYIIHPVAVANILIGIGMDEKVVAAAFLHDVIEDTPATAADVKERFGTR